MGISKSILYNGCKREVIMEQTEYVVAWDSNMNNLKCYPSIENCVMRGGVMPKIVIAESARLAKEQYQMIVDGDL